MWALCAHGVVPAPSVRIVTILTGAFVRASVLIAKTLGCEMTPDTGGETEEFRNAHGEGQTKS